MAVMRFASALLAAASLAVAAPSPPAPLPTSIATSELNVDVAIVGAGASGGYAAVRLKEDFGKTIAVIEKGAALGGHVSTYDDPVAGRAFEFGVQTFNDYGPAADFFDRLGIEYSEGPRAGLTDMYVDFRTGDQVAFVPAAFFPNTLTALQTFLDVVAPWENLILPGYWNFPDPEDIPADLLLPFGDFVVKHGIQDCVNLVFQITGMGTGDMKNSLTMYVLSAFGPPMMRAFLGVDSIFTPNSRRNIEVYEKIQARLASELLLDSTVVQSERSNTGHILWVKNHSTGVYTLVRAAKLLIAIEPTKANMKPFALDAEEKAVFGKFKHQRVHAGIVSHPQLPQGISIVNTVVEAVPSNYLELPKPNFNGRFDHMGAGSSNWRVLMVGDEKFDSCKAQKLVKKNFRDMRAKGTLPSGGPVDVEIKAWADHGAMHMHFPKKEIEEGYIQRLYALQGRTQTWWTGGAFSHQFQSVLWAFDDVLLGNMGL
ncbi:hypothetical protein QBC34DRAFT_316579 [Podospora aff. communis PSN243]|uniref:Amine oxidase domain-containing protein n=1 Tax=Podospora aff. communis PSN243 TaxID=3040156 RepID=A0AAV9H2E5_9PEZI|nr:hypothetical protein QBC34DRAFT_316579 [Podospora aff. communis PSN243]